MSELKVNTISGLGGTVKINNPVGIGGVNRSGYDLSVEGKVNMEGSVEVVTVPASNFGVRIRAPLTATTSPGFGDSTLQFTNNQGSTEWASLHAKSDSSLSIRVNNTERLTIDAAETTRFLDKTQFVKDASFEKATNFANQPPTCSVLPTIGNHLANKTYVDNMSKGNTQYISLPNNPASAVSKSITLKQGTYAVVFTSCVQFNDGNQNSNSLQTLSATSLSLTTTNSHLNNRGGDAGHGRLIEITSSTATQFAVSSSGTYTFSLSLPSIGTSRGATALIFYLG